MITWPIATMAAQSNPYSAARLSEWISRKTAAYTGRRARTTPSAEATATTHPTASGTNSESNAITPSPGSARPQPKASGRARPGGTSRLGRNGRTGPLSFRLRGPVVHVRARGSCEWVMALFGRGHDGRVEGAVVTVDLTEVEVLRDHAVELGVLRIDICV